MWLMLNHAEPTDFVVATGETHTVREFCTLAFQAAGIDIKWEGSGLEGKGIDSASGKIVVRVNEEFYRPAEVDELVGNNKKAQRELGWQPKTDFRGLISMMVESESDLQKEGVTK